MTATLPARPHIEHLKKQAKDLLSGHRDGDLRLGITLREYLPRLVDQTDAEVLATGITLHDAQYVVSARYGFENWAALREAVESAKIPSFDKLDERMCRHLESLGFSTVGGYRVWCHRQKLANSLDKSDAQLVAELERARFSARCAASVSSWVWPRSLELQMA